MITIHTSKPADLLKQIRAAIDSNSIDTWSYDKVGDFTHTPPQWFKKAWLRPTVAPGQLRLAIIAQKDVKMSKEVYGVYHGRFIEMALVHFDNLFTKAEASALATVSDNIA